MYDRLTKMGMQGGGDKWVTGTQKGSGVQTMTGLATNRTTKSAHS